MAIVVDTFEENGRTFTRTYSDVGRYVVREGVLYPEAIDPIEWPREYTEGEYMPPEEGGEPDPREIIEILTGEVEAQ